MKTRGGFISIICLIVMSVLMIMILYLEVTTKMEHLILSSTSNNIQSYYLAEGKIHLALYEDKYYSNQLYPILTEYFRALPFSKQPKDIIINKEDLVAEDDISNIKVNLVDKDDRKQLRLIARSNFRGLKTKVTSHITVFNELFEMGSPILDVNNIEDDYKEDLKELLFKISEDINIDNCNKPENIYAGEFTNFNKIILDKNDDSTFELLSLRETMVEPYIERFSNKEVLLIIRKFGEEPTNLFIGNSDKLNETIKLSGVIYIEGSIIISKSFEFNGIIIVNNGELIIHDNIRPNIKGIVIVDNILNNDFLEKTDIIYSRHSIYKYGTYLPGVIEPKIDLIKSD